MQLVYEQQLEQLEAERTPLSHAMLETLNPLEMFDAFFAEQTGQEMNVAQRVLVAKALSEQDDG